MLTKAIISVHLIIKLYRAIRMKAVSVLAVLECFLFINSLQQLGWAAPTMSESNEDVVAVSSDVKRDAEYRNALFGVYACRVKKAAAATVDKIEVTNL